MFNNGVRWNEEIKEMSMEEDDVEFRKRRTIPEAVHALTTPLAASKLCDLATTASPSSSPGLVHTKPHTSTRWFASS